jgi:hypothetical protein
MDKRKVLGELLRGNTEPLIEAIEEKHKDIKWLFAHRYKNEEHRYFDIKIRYTNGKEEERKEATKAEHQGLMNRMIRDSIPFVVILQK